MLEASKNDPPELIVFENVPRIANRGHYLLDQIVALLRAYGYAVAETPHDCGELGGLAQSRKRLSHGESAAISLRGGEALRAVGDILGRMPLPGDLRAGPMHRVPSLQWKTWVRLAFVEAGVDWRSLNKLHVEDGKLADYLLIPETRWEGGGRLGVTGWEDPSVSVAGASRPENGRFVADPRLESLRLDRSGYAAGTIACAPLPEKAFPPTETSPFADPRFDQIREME